jgi:putative addiction module component (TIGR02574 family)
MCDMGRKLQDLYEEAAELPDRERAELAGRLIESLETEIDPDVEVAWAEEIERRIHQIDSGEAATISWEQVRGELFARLTDEG